MSRIKKKYGLYAGAQGVRNVRAWCNYVKISITFKALYYV